MSRLRQLKRQVEDGLGTPPATVVGATIAGYTLIGVVVVRELLGLIGL